MLGRLLWNKYGMIVLGVVLLGLGAVLFNQADPTCGSETMKPGMVCDTTKRGTTTTTTYEEEKSSQTLAGKVMLGVGPLLILGGITWIVVSRRRKPEEAVPAAA